MIISKLQDGPTNGCVGGTKLKGQYDTIQSVTYTVEALDPCSSYNFEVVAVNAAGTGENSTVRRDTAVGGRSHVHLTASKNV